LEGCPGIDVCVKAIFQALVDWPGDNKMCRFFPLRLITILNAFRVLCVTGAGRGPIVARSLSAIERSGREAHVYAVEKNPNAYVTYVPKVVLHHLVNLMYVQSAR
jgi:protein arginine N-methyltransferase 5